MSCILDFDKEFEGFASDEERQGSSIVKKKKTREKEREREKGRQIISFVVDIHYYPR